MSSIPLPTVEQRYRDTAQAFDSVAAEYDGPLGNNRLVQQMRETLWRTVRRLVTPGARLLDLGCGTGLDAVYFAQQGHCVTAMDWSASMVLQTQQRAKRAGVADRLTAVQLGIQDLSALAGELYDVIYSDLGTLNCLPDLAGLARTCDGLLEPGGVLAFSVIGRFCPWELAYYVARGKLRRARVRFSHGQVPVGLNGHTVWTRYYTPGEFYQHFVPWFRWRTCRSLGLFLPPPYMLAFWERHLALFRPLAWLERHASALPLINQIGDHFLLMMERHA
ncbi:MAG: methyltransferase domain-containing protein [Chloroflexi bacterium]|nr:methyltransferase domain-containing protein [Chloroflexota bacterium]